MNKNPKMLTRLWWLLWLMGKLLLCNVCQPRSLSSASVEKHRMLPLVLLCITTINCQSAPGDESDHPLGLFSDTLVSESQEAPRLSHCQLHTRLDLMALEVFSSLEDSMILNVS